MTQLIRDGHPSGDPRFSRILPGLQTKVNSSSLGPFKQCPRKYEYEIVRGLRSHEDKIDLVFGTLVHKGLETYDRCRFAGLSHDSAIEASVHEALTSTWDSAVGRAQVFAHAQKNRESLIRTLVWYFDKYGENDLETVILDGKPAVELTFQFSSGLVSEATGEPIDFIGRLDKLVRLNGGVYIKDPKTTKSGLGSHYFTRYSPDNQFSLYVLAGRVAFDTEIKGLIADAIQIGTNFVRFERALVPRPNEVIEEWLVAARWWLRLMERCAIDHYWPQNDKSCGLYGGCEFREVCSMRPASRETWLERNYARLEVLEEVP